MTVRWISSTEGVLPTSKQKESPSGGFFRGLQLLFELGGVVEEGRGLVWMQRPSSIPSPKISILSSMNNIASLLASRCSFVINHLPRMLREMVKILRL